MTQTLTPDEASKAWQCPMARTFADPMKMCRGDACAMWRFLPLNADDPAFTSAVQREVDAMHQETGKAKNLLHKAAVKRVMADPSRYSIPGHHEVGYCGLGGRP